MDRLSWDGSVVCEATNTDCSCRRGEGNVLIAIFAAALSLKWALTVRAVDKPWLKRCVSVVLWVQSPKDGGRWAESVTNSNWQATQV